MNKIFTFLTLSLVAISAQAQPPAPQPIGAQRAFNIEIFETGEDDIMKFDNAAGERTRGVLGDVWKLMRGQYASTLSGQLMSASGDILSSAIGIVYDAVRSKRGDWEAQTRKDCVFIKDMPMKNELHDFYANTSTNGALDPDGILFDGFGCSQYYIQTNPQGKPDTIPVLYLRCRLRNDEYGRNRILHHGKFEVEIDSMFYNPMVSNLPNDSLSISQIDLRTPFDFQRRKNLTIKIDTDITSSWMNEAIQVVDDRSLGKFAITLRIPDASALETSGPYKGCYIYHKGDNKSVRPIVEGESFIVPRSFIGTGDMETYTKVWGTGQYKVNMKLTEMCDINMDFYYDDSDPAPLQASDFMPQTRRKHKWNRYWTEEWNKIKKRRKSPNFFKGLVDNVAVNYKNGRWVYTFLQPVANSILSVEQVKLNKHINEALGITPQIPAAAATQGKPQGQPQGNPQK